MIVQTVSKISDDALTDIIHKKFLAVHPESPHDVDQNNRNRDDLEHRFVFVKENIIEHGFDQEGGGRCRRCNHEHAAHCQHQPQPVLLYQGEYLFMPRFECG